MPRWRRHESTPALGIYFYEPTSISSKGRKERLLYHWHLPRGLQVLSLLPLPHTSYPELRFQPRDFVKKLLKPPHPEGPLVHPIPMSLENSPGISSSAELLQLLNLNCRAKHCLILQLRDMPSSWTGQLEVRTGLLFPTSQVPNTRQGP